EYHTHIRNLKKEGFNILGYARKSNGPEPHEKRVQLLKLMCKRLKDRSLVDHVYVSL
ncbi:hypothetical protein DM01DRAFT_1276722, partial [Hesseltinella vesiculosa]